ncbi:ABC-type transport system permease protein (probable substrate dipeptide/oligopeptide) [Natronomonas pharaonis DSM 2160]|uniref:ABC-type transport system permease protein (Probable substrate dipeptide/oligopeptide) n=1 Tax=Natronomonas pharaonis (strain ATCC 35678 / DSM 2160 / CIP 103997 / JCM 8858 / NBRC 14720 / NCIMB 2260 / Gabara) TaxID=348780 RepID=A0A1U7EU55_NATPD|nr:ABC transporter permease [Natronomonas pharaonis]CAI48472.1 ABC-type transport system permease protein (probable substrate dipeptide/oligopeptide) [Natronomonas pharaonis DSM 2160]
MISDRAKQSLSLELKRSRLAQIGVAIMAVMFVVTMFAPLFAPHDPEQQRVGTGDTEDMTDLPPVGFSTTANETRLVDGEFQTQQVEINANSSHVLGTNTRGQDVLSRVIYGGRVSLLVGLLGAAIAALVGVPYGLAAGYFSGRVDDALMRGADIMLAFPSLVLAIALVGVFRETDFHTMELTDPFVVAAQSETIPNWLIPRAGHVASMPESVTFPVTVTLVVALVNWVWFARVARGEAMSIRSEEYVTAAKSLGASNWTIIRKHVLPNSITPIIVLATIQVAFIILLESALSFLGFSGTTLTWGQDIARGQSDQRAQWWIATVPGLAIVLAVIGVNLIGDWLRDALDPDIEGEGGGV